MSVLHTTTPSPCGGEGGERGFRSIQMGLSSIRHPHPTSPSALRLQGFVSFSLEGEGGVNA